MEDCSEDEINQAMRWAQLAGIVSTTDQGSHIIDPVVGRLLRDAKTLASE